MASTPTPTPTQTPPRLSIKNAARKLPIKRKNPDSQSRSSPVPDPIPKSETPDDDHNATIDRQDDDLEKPATGREGGEDLKAPPPFKYHRIWVESDEIRFLQGLLDCSAVGFVFPRDLPLFYDRFSQSMSQPYTKTQLSEKLRRLRKKYRVISTRISRGLTPSLLSPHDTALFALSKQLWHPSYASSSPFQSNKQNSSEVRPRVGFSPIPSADLPPLLPAPAIQDPSGSDVNDANIVEENTTELNPETNLDGEQELYLPITDGSRDDELRRLAAKTIMDVFDESFKEFRMTLVQQGFLYPDQFSTSTTDGSSKQGNSVDFEKRWREQRAQELDLLARRLRLVLENATMKASRPL